MRSRLLAVGRPVPEQPSPEGWPGVAGVVVAVEGVQVTAKAVGDVLRWPVAELVAAQGGAGVVQVRQQLKEAFQQELAWCGRLRLTLGRRHAGWVRCDP
jgi:hypothetical protein